MISNEVKEFLSKNKNTNKSELEKYKEDIFYLKNNNITTKEIHKFLVEKFAINSSYQNLSQWIKRQKTTTVDIETETSKNQDMIKKYDNVNGNIKKHNLSTKIVRPKI